MKYLEYVPLVLHNYKKLNITKIVIFIISSFLSDESLLVTTAQKFSEKQRSIPLIQQLYISFHYKLKTFPFNINLLQNTKTRYQF